MAAEIVENGVATVDKPIDEIENDETNVQKVEEVIEEAKVTMETEVDRDSLVPVTGSLNGDLEDAEDVSEVGEEMTEEEEDDENMSNVVQGTTETILNKLEENLAQVAEVDESELLQMAEPGPLEAEGRDIEQVLSIISQSIYREGEGQVVSKLCDRSALLSVVSHSLSAYITTLESLPLQRLSSRIATEVSMWMCDLFNFSAEGQPGQAHCHDDIREGLVRTVRMVLYSRYPNLVTDGFMALTSSPPVLYITSRTYTEVAHYVCNQLNLPNSSVRFVCPEEGCGDSDELELFKKALEEDAAAGRTPLMCVANVHSSIFQKHSVSKLQELCETSGLWLHLEGHALSALSLLPANTSFKHGDSMTLTFGSWIGIPALPFVTLYKNIPTAANIAGLGLVNPSVRLGCLPLWCVLRSLGHNQVRSRITSVFTMLENISSKLTSMESVRLLSHGQDQSSVSISSLESGAVAHDQMFNTVSPALAFQYIGPSPPDLETRVPAYTDNLNSWLGQILQRDAPHVPVEIVDVETTGYVLRLCPFEDVTMVGLSPDDVDQFLQCLDDKCAILNSTVEQRSKFISLIEKEPNLQHIDIAHWAGLGGVRYIPSEFISSEDTEPRQLSDMDLKLVNQRNMELVATLRSTDSAFSLGEGPEHSMCVRFGMVTMDTDVEELLSLVINCGKDIDEAVSHLENLSEVVKKGMIQAQDELQKEADNQLWQEGLLRHVPIVGSFYNWLSPLPEDAKVKGRSLNLREGKLESTESIYKHHMQIHIEDGQEL